MPDHDVDSAGIWSWFALVSIVCLAVLAVSPVKDYFRDYRGHQEEYREQLLSIAGSSKELREARNLTVRINQIWIPDLGDRVDRCTTCHLGVDNRKMADAAQPFRAHPLTAHTPGDFQRFGCVVCHRGQGRATSSEDAHGDVEDWSAPILDPGDTEASCGICHEGDEVPEATLLSTGRRLIRQAQCAGCHELKGYEERRPTAPRLDGLAQKTTLTWLKAWLRGPREMVPTTRMPDFHLTEDEATALAAWLWSRPPLRRVEPAVDFIDGDYDRGKKIFREARCISCHTVEGRGNGSAPELVGVGSKVTSSWLLAYLENPHSFQPETEMPRYEFSRTDLEDIVTYMMEELTDPSLDLPTEEPGRPSPRLLERGEEIYRTYGCGGCHRLGDEEGPVRIGPTLIGIGAKPVALLDFGTRDDLPRTISAWLEAKVADPRSFRKDLRMPDFGLDEAQLGAIVVALLSQTGESIPPEYRVEAPSSRYDPPGRFGDLVDRYRCLSCHEVEGTGGDISTAPLTAEGSKVKQDWLKEYLLLPTTIRPILTDRMIPLGMSEEDAAFMAEFMSNVYVDDRIPRALFEEGIPADAAEKGRALFHERYGCRSCHQIEGVGGYYGPPLDDAPWKLNAGWVAWWLQDPQRWRDDVRCPNFGMSEGDATQIAAYLTSRESEPSPGGER